MEKISEFFQEHRKTLLAVKAALFLLVVISAYFVSHSGGDELEGLAAKPQVRLKVAALPVT